MSGGGESWAVGRVCGMWVWGAGARMRGWVRLWGVRRGCGASGVGRWVGVGVDGREREGSIKP